MANPSPHRASFSAARKWVIALNVFASCAALLALVLMVNYLASRHFGQRARAASLQLARAITRKKFEPLRTALDPAADAWDSMMGELERKL